MSSDRADWPIPNYKVAWQAFRSRGNEPDATAAHLVRQTRWPKTSGLRLLDIGCGDGKMIRAILEASADGASVVLLDPDEAMLSQAMSEVHSACEQVEIRCEEGVADVEGLSLAVGADVGLAIHLAYLLPHNRFRYFLNHWVEGRPLFVVLDAPESVFSSLWAETAPDYAARSRRAHEYLSSMDNRLWEVVRTEFTTTVADPFDLPLPSQHLVLSLLCYCDYEECDANQRVKVEQVIRRYRQGGCIRCACTCYQVYKHTE